MHDLRAAVAALLLSACGGGGWGGNGGGGFDSLECPTVQIPNGVPVQDRPSREERLGLYAADRARLEPEKTGWSEFPPVVPLLWSDLLAQAARAHSSDMRDTPCFQHQSCDGTDPFDRIKQFWQKGGALGENIAAGSSDPIYVVEQMWINEIGAAPGETGHRENMFSKSFTWVGFGFEKGGKKYQGYWTQDFGGTPALVPKLPVGSYSLDGTGAKLGVVYYDAANAVPDRVEAIVDGQTLALVRVRGTASAGAYEGAAPMAMGCHRYRFRALVGQAISCYPSSGTLGFAVGSVQECVDYLP